MYGSEKVNHCQSVKKTDVIIFYNASDIFAGYTSWRPFYYRLPYIISYRITVVFDVSEKYIPMTIVTK